MLWRQTRRLLNDLGRGGCHEAIACTKPKHPMVRMQTSRNASIGDTNAPEWSLLPPSFLRTTTNQEIGIHGYAFAFELQIIALEGGGGGKSSIIRKNCKALLKWLDSFASID